MASPVLTPQIWDTERGKKIRAEGRNISFHSSRSVRFWKGSLAFKKQVLEDGDEWCSICVLHGKAKQQQTETRRYNFLTDSTQHFNVIIWSVLILMYAKWMTHLRRELQSCLSVYLSFSLIYSETCTFFFVKDSQTLMSFIAGGNIYHQACSSTVK